MKRLFLFCLATLVFNSCLKDESTQEYFPFDISGSVSKGTYLSGSNITFYELEDELGQTGGSYFTSIADGAGTYNLNIGSVEEDYTLAIANGYYWDEVRNIVSDGELDLKGVFKWSESININVLSHIEAERVLHLIQNEEVSGSNDRKRFKNAKKQALNEVLAAFGIDEEFEQSEDFNFIDGDNKSKILVAISSAIQADRDTFEVEALLAELSEDIRTDGTLDSDVLKEQIGSRLCILNIDNLSQNVFDKVLRYNPNLTDRSFVSNYLDQVKAAFSGYNCDPVMRFGRNTISIGLKTESIDERCNELTFFKDLNNDGIKDANEIVLNKIVICGGEDGSNSPLIGLDVKESTECANGGRVYTFFYDTNENGVLDTGEQEISVETVCNGDNGEDGSDGSDGNDGSDGSDGQDGQDAVQLGVFVTNVEEGECENGGLVFNVFKDLDFDGEFDESSESIIRSTTLCFPEPELECRELTINDDLLEYWLIEQGFDDVYNNKVNTCNLAEVTRISTAENFRLRYPINFEIFPNLEEIELGSDNNFDFSPDYAMNFQNNEKLVRVKTGTSAYEILLPFNQIEELEVIGDNGKKIIKNDFKISSMPNLKLFKYYPGYYYGAPDLFSDLVVNENLVEIDIRTNNQSSFPLYDLSNFPNLEKIYFDQKTFRNRTYNLNICGLTELRDLTFVSNSGVGGDVFNVSVEEAIYNQYGASWNFYGYETPNYIFDQCD